MSNSKIKEELKKEFDNYKQLKKEFIDLKHTDSVKEIYIINKEWYLKWKKYVTHEEQDNNVTDYSLKQSNPLLSPGKINNNYIIYSPKDFVNDKNNQIYILREDMKDKIKILSSAMWKFFLKKYEGGPEIKRQYVEVEEDLDVKPSRILDLFHKIVNIIFIVKIDNNILLDQFLVNRPYKIFVSPVKTVYDFKKIIMNAFSNVNPSLIKTNYFRVWRLEEKYNINNLREFIKSKKHVILKEKSIIFPGFLFDFIPNLKLQEVELLDKDLFVSEVIIQNFKKDLTPIFNLDNNLREQMCDFCRTNSFLFYSCKCQKVWYCNEKCMITDYKKHKLKCHFPNKNIVEELLIEESKESLHGLVGIKNLGNTCYMNTALQCLSNCYELSLYFLKKNYKSDLNTENEFGKKGIIALNYAKLIRHLWYGREKMIVPVEFKRSMARLNSNFIGYNQQDSQEYLIYLLDALHEDLNKVKKKNFINEIDLKNKSESKASNEAWIHYLTRNQSIIVELFCGQYKSTISCLTCKIISIKYDPFYILSLPIPDLEYVELKIVFINYNLAFGSFMFNIKIEQDAKVINLRKKISKAFKIPLFNFLLCSIINNRIDRIFNSNIPVVKLTSTICCFQIDPSLFNSDSNRLKILDYVEPSLELELNFSVEENLTRNQFSFREDEIRCDPISTYYSNLDSTYTKMSDIQHNAGKGSENSNKSDTNASNILNVDLKVYCDDNHGLNNDFIKVVFYLRAINKTNILISKQDLTFPRLIYLNKNWKLSYIHRYIFSFLKPFIQDSQKYSGLKYISDDEGFDKVYSRPDKIIFPQVIEGSIPYVIKIINNNANHRKPCLICKDLNCKNCLLIYNENVQLLSILQKYPIVNEMTVDNNYLYLDMLQRKLCLGKNDFEIEIIFEKYFLKKDKFFSQAKTSKTVNSSFLSPQNYSLSVYDCLNRFIQIEDLECENAWLCTNCKSLEKAKKNIEISKNPLILILQLKRFKNNHKVKTTIDFPLNNLDLKYFFGKNIKIDISTKYDLFGVCNHYGSLNSGHYYAFCKNSLNGKWYKYDDSEVTEISDKDVVSPYSYVLFYRRKDVLNGEYDIEKLFNKPFVDYENLLKNNYFEEERSNETNNETTSNAKDSRKLNNTEYLKDKF